MSSNPFRKFRTEDRILALDTSPAPTPPPPVSFKTHVFSPPAASPLQTGPTLAVPRTRSESPLPPSAIATDESRQRRKSSGVVRKVKILSPPQSPDEVEAAWPFNVPMGMDGQQHGQLEPQQQQKHLQQFEGKEYAFPSVEDFERGRTAELQEPQQQQDYTSLSVPPPNPFNKTLHDLETSKQKEKSLHHQEELEGAALRAGNLAKGSLDVDAFRRLLMTGKSEGMSGSGNSDGTASPLPSRRQIVEDLATPDDLSSDESENEKGENLSRRETGAVAGGSALVKEVRREDIEGEAKEDDNDSGEESESSVSVQIGTRGKKPPPPPPSSRHGRSIIPHKPSEELVPEPSPAAEREPVVKAEANQEETDHTTTPITTPKKPVPAPPPRRGHARTDTAKTIGLSSPGKGAGEDTPPRSSMESHTSATKISPPSDSQSPGPAALKPAPAPPPPRRPARSGSNNANMTPSPGLSPAIESAGLDEPDGTLTHAPSHQEAGKHAPPPPPARHGSIRKRPAAVPLPGGAEKDASSASMSSVGKHKLGVPPPAPPPPRQRGSSKGSVDGAGARGVAAQHMEQDTEAQHEQGGKGGDILADLEALQREVDAMRVKLR